MYAPGCQVECSGPNCGSGKAHQYYNTQADWKSSCSTPVCGQHEEEASLLQHAPAGCEGLSRTVPSRCPAGVKGTSTGVEINTQLTCVYDPQCAEPGGDPAAKCYEQTTCAYKAHSVAQANLSAPGDDVELGGGQTCCKNGDDNTKCYIEYRCPYYYCGDSGPPAILSVCRDKVDGSGAGCGAVSRGQCCPASDVGSWWVLGGCH
jgi:hypothetical protein